MSSSTPVVCYLTRNSFTNLILGGLLCSVPISFLGCASDSYRYGFDNPNLANQPISEESSATLLVGGEKPRIDQIEKIVQTPRRMIRKLFRLPIPDPDESATQREQALLLADGYLASNGISDLISTYVYTTRKYNGSVSTRMSVSLHYGNLQADPLVGFDTQSCPCERSTRITMILSQTRCI